MRGMRYGIGLAVLAACVTPAAAHAHVGVQQSSAFSVQVQPPSLVQTPWRTVLIDSDAAGASRRDAPVYDSKNTDGQAGSGPAGVVYRAGGKPVTEANLRKPIPDALLWRTGYGSWEPTLGVTKKGTVFFSARNTNVDPGVVRSKDGGRTWEEKTPMQHEISLDPYVWVDEATGRVWANDIEASVTCPPLSYSDDEGETWTTLTVCGQFDHQSLFGGPPATSTPTGYPHVVYYCAISGGALAGSSTVTGCSRSRDGGVTFVPTESLPFPARQAPPEYADYNPWCDGAAGHGVVDSKGVVYLARGWCAEPYIAISRDEGATWEQVKLPGENFPLEGHEANVAVDREGTVYVTWVTKSRRAVLTVSKDGGKTWREPLDVNPPGIHGASLPNIDVGEPGRIAMTFMGGTTPAHAGPPARAGQPALEARSDAFMRQEELTWNAYMVISPNATNDSPVFYAATVNDPADPFWRGACDTQRCGNIGDFLDVEITPDGTPVAALVDSCPTDGGKTCTGFDVHLPRGEAVMGQLVGGPPLVGTIADQTPDASLPAQKPPAPACRPRKPLRIALKRPKRGRIASATVYVNGKKVKTVRGRKTVRLKRLPAGRAVVKVVVRSTSGRSTTRTRRYVTCAG